MKFVGSIAVVAATVCGLAAAQQNSTLPTVDLGYEVHQAIAFNQTGQYYNFSNIRYAQPPVGDLRFARPVPPSGRNPTVQNGNQSWICPQASPVWQLIGIQLATAFANGSLDSFNYSAARDVAMAQLISATNQTATPDPRVTEDCLFLDVMVPQAAFDGRNRTSYMNRALNSNGTTNSTTNSTGAPVIVWIYGGGYTLGSKVGSGNPAGLIAASMQNNGTNGTDGAIFVAMNYRLGALGWLSGPGFQGEGGISNAGLYDQRLAIQWVRQNIGLFGGDPNRITLMGESAGGGSIMYQMTAYGGCKGVNFQQAIIQSPGWFPTSNLYTQENTTNTFYRYLNVSSLAEARLANSSAVIRANALQVGLSVYGSYTYGPVTDGIFSPAQPGLLLQNGAFAKDVKVMAGHNTNEGVFFAPAYVTTNADVLAWIKTDYPFSPPPVSDYILNTLYPADYNGTQNYTSPLTRTMKIVTEQIFTCNTNYLARALNGQTYNYQFEIPPALHGNDVPYTFYNGGGGVDVSTAKTLQGYITRFAATGNPNGPGLPYFPMQGSSAMMVGLNTTGVTIQTDPTANQRCKWWQKYLYT